MKTVTKIFFYLTLLLLFTNCASTRTSTIVGAEYNASKNVTDYFVLPYGSVSIPGEWIKTNYNSINRQQFFSNKDSITLAIAIGYYDKYEFNTDGRFKGFDFVNAYYEWDSKYFVESLGLQRQAIERDSLTGYITYRIFGQIEKVKINTYWLVYENNGNITNISIFDTDKWTELEKLTFMKSLVQQKEE